MLWCVYGGAKTVTVTGGILSEIANRDNAIINVGFIFQDITVYCYVESYSDLYPGQIGKYTGHGEDMNVYVDKNSGNEIVIQLDFEVKYNGVWHEVSDGDEHIKYWMTGMSEPTNRSWISSNGPCFDIAYESMPGDVITVKYYFDDVQVGTFDINIID
ncbi:MAG: hypothetical protein IJQ93_08475 [Bacteroidales bacterium]|nr:hypothetical protein [Bacteroidales bacterium]